MPLQLVAQLDDLNRRLDAIVLRLSKPIYLVEESRSHSDHPGSGERMGKTTSSKMRIETIYPQSEPRDRLSFEGRHQFQNTGTYHKIILQFNFSN